MTSAVADWIRTTINPKSDITTPDFAGKGKSST